MLKKIRAVGAKNDLIKLHNMILAKNCTLWKLGGSILLRIEDQPRNVLDTGPERARVYERTNIT